jgi:hypothetical protein
VFCVERDGGRSWGWRVVGLTGRRGGKVGERRRGGGEGEERGEE